jgi:serine/threonine-protein kinase
MSELHQAVLEAVNARVGRVVGGQWKIDAVLGVGGMAAVYAATHTDGHRAALKMLHPQLSMNADIRTRFTREGYVANSIRHPGVVRVLGDGVAEDGAAFLVMELLEGETAAERAERAGGRLAPREAVRIADGVLDALAAAHAAGIIHRDIKPDNVFCTTDGRVMVLDFGIARVYETSGLQSSGTRTGTMMGTPAFMPPEQALGRVNQIDAASDVWATGALLFWLLTGRSPHHGDNANEQLISAATLPCPSIATVAPGTPLPLVGVIDTALAFVKASRYSSATEMQRALRLAATQLTDPQAMRAPVASGPHSDLGPTIHITPTLGPTPVEPPTRRAAAAAAGGITVAVALALFLFLGVRGGTTAAPSRVAATQAPVGETAPATPPPVPVAPSPEDPAHGNPAHGDPAHGATTVVDLDLPPAADAGLAAQSAAPKAVPKPRPSATQKSWLDRRR